MNIYISFAAACFIAENMGDRPFCFEGNVNKMIRICRKDAGEFLLKDGSKIMWRKNVGWFIKTYP
jgi:hypothetical protein